ncbi:MAG: DUF1800 family protein [Flavobacteriales bacterium]
MALTPYTGPFGRPELIHLIRRTLFGVAPADLTHFNGMSLQQVVDELLTFSNNTTPPVKAYSVDDGNGNMDPSLIDVPVAYGTTWVNTPRDPNEVFPDPAVSRIISFVEWWSGLIAQQDRTLREKLTLFWHNTLVTQISVAFLPEANYQYCDLLRTQAKGNFRQLMYDMTINPAMLYYLNGYLNNAFAPDENYAREVMELFTLGEGSGYTESDVQQAARVLTGWTIAVESGGNPIVPTTVYYPFLHEAGNKQFSSFFNNTLITGNAGPNGGALELNALLDMIFLKEEVSLHICRELYRFFVHSDIDATIEADVIVPLAQIFRDNSGAPDQMGIVMNALLTSDRFFSNEVRGCMVKSPMDYTYGMVRQMGQPFPTSSQLEAQYSAWFDVRNIAAYAGQSLADPPNVAGWPAYYQFPQYDTIWMDAANYALRKQISDIICYVGFYSPANTYEPQSANVNSKIDFTAFVAQFQNPIDPNALIDEAAELLFATPLSQGVKDQLKTNFLLFGQQSDIYWSQAWSVYSADPNTTDPYGMLVPVLLLSLFLDMQTAAEYHLH